MNNQIEASVKNHYHFELCDAETGEIKQVVDCHNVVLNQYYTGIKTGNTLGEPTAIAIGTGTKAPSAGDTALQNQIYICDIGSANPYNSTNENNKIVTSFPTATRTLKYTIPAADCIGALTECAIGSKYYSYISSYHTRALFVDSEGNPIVINKTATDILKITVTIYYTLTLEPHAQEGTNVFMCNKASHAAFSALISNNGIYPGNVRFLHYPATQYEDTPITSDKYNKNINGKLVNGVYTGYVDYLYSDDVGWNGSLGMDVKALHIQNIGAFNITSDIFPPTPIPKYQTGTGDGVNKKFDIKTPSSIAGTQKVYVNSVLQTEGVDYTYKPINTKQAYTNYLSADVRKIVSAAITQELYYTREWQGLPGYPVLTNDINPSNGCGYLTKDQPIVYDFGVPVKVNCIKMGPQFIWPFKETVSLEYSVDGTTWVNYQTLSSLALDSFNETPEVTARYWRYVTTYTERVFIRYAVWSAYTPIVLFGYYEPNITFTTAPSANAVIEIEYSIKYPLHNSMHSIRFGYTQEVVC